MEINKYIHTYTNAFKHINMYTVIFPCISLQIQICIHSYAHIFMHIIRLYMHAYSPRGRYACTSWLCSVKYF